MNTVCKPDISVVIPTYNRLNVLKKSLRKLQEEGSRCTSELVVVSDGSTDGTEDYLRGISRAGNVTIIVQDNKGAAAARNAGAAQANAEILLFVDDDMRAADLLLDNHLANYKKDKDLDAVVGCMNFDETSPKTILSGYVCTWAREFKLQLIQKGITSGNDILSGHFSIKKDAFYEIGGFHEYFTQGGRYGNEDIDFGNRLFYSNKKLKYCPSAVTEQYYNVVAKVKFKQAIDLAVADRIFAERAPAGKQLLAERRASFAFIKNPLIGILSDKFPKLTYYIFYPIRILTCRLIDSGMSNLLVHYLFGLNQAVAYRLGLSKNIEG